MLHKTLDPYEIANNSFSVLSVIFDSLRSLLRSCLRQSISLWSVVVNSAGFGLMVVSGIKIRLGGVIALVALFSGTGSLPNFE